jgi:hypothetical protein
LPNVPAVVIIPDVPVVTGDPAVDVFPALSVLLKSK